MAAPEKISANSLRASSKVWSGVTRFSYPRMRQAFTTPESQVTCARLWSANGVESASQLSRLNVSRACFVSSR